MQWHNNHGVITHAFPHPERNPEIFKAWVAIVGGKLETDADYAYYRTKTICDIHYIDADKNRNHRLNALAVPTLYLSGSTNEIMHLFPHPVNDADRFRSWLYNIGGDLLQMDNMYIYKNRKVCHLHFETKFHTRSRRLHCAAVPTLHLPGSKSNVPVEKIKIENVFSKHEDSAVDTDESTSKYEDIAVDTIKDDLLKQEEGTTFFADERSNVVYEETRQKDTVVYNCNECEQEILGYRYICVQCSDYDLCSTCEGKGLHFLHYVLRVPACKTQVEVEVVLTAVRRAINSMHLNQDHEFKIKEETEVLLDKIKSEPPLTRDPFADDASVAESGTVAIDYQTDTEDFQHEFIHCDPIKIESVFEDSVLVPEGSCFGMDLDCSKETGDKVPKKEKLTETSLHNLEVFSSDQATEKCDTNITHNESKKILLKMAPKNFVLQNVSTPNKKVLLKLAKTESKGNILATEGTMHTTESRTLPAKGAVLVAGNTTSIRRKSIPVVITKNTSTGTTVPTVVRSIPTSERTIPIVERSIPTTESSLQSTKDTLSTDIKNVSFPKETVTKTVKTYVRKKLKETKDTLSSDIKNMNFCKETVTTTKIYEKVSMSSFKHADESSLPEPVRKKLKEDVQGAQLSSETCQTSTENV